MEFSDPEAVEGDELRGAVHRALHSSYALSPETIEALIEEQFDDDRLAEKADDGGVRLLVAHDGEEVAGLAEGHLDDGTGSIEWLFVEPGSRGQGTGTELFERTRSALDEAGADRIQATVLSDNMEGSTFFDRFGMVEADTTKIEIDDEPHSAEVYVDADETDSAEPKPERIELDELPETVETDEGEFPVDQEETKAGTKGPFLLAYADPDTEDLAGYYCTYSETLVQAMDDLGRIQCGDCGNIHRADEWDASYL